MKLYLDADGVICNFEKAVLDLGPVPAMGLVEDANPQFKENMYKRIEEAGERFWSLMPWAPQGKELWDYFKKYNPIILTSPGKFSYAKSGRLLWFKKNLPGVQVIFDTDKWYWAERDSILIDDMDTNIEPWLRMGGIGILHKSFEETKKEFEEIMAKPSMKVSLASYLRDVVALLSINNLKEYLNKAQGVLPSGSHLKSVIIREILDKANLKSGDIKNTYQKLKEIVKGYEPSNRKPFQLTILQPLQAFFNQVDRFDPSDMNKAIREYKDVMRKPEQELSESKKLVRDVSEIPFPKVLNSSDTKKVVPR
jgi:hypothetical protein